METYIPTKKSTGVDWEPITEEQKEQWESDPTLRGKYTFRLVETAEEAKEEAKEAPKDTNPKEPKKTPKEITDAG